jgi:hypothetical protein
MFRDGVLAFLFITHSHFLVSMFLYDAKMELSL